MQPNNTDSTVSNTVSYSALRTVSQSNNKMSKYNQVIDYPMENYGRDIQSNLALRI